MPKENTTHPTRRQFLAGSSTGVVATLLAACGQTATQPSTKSAAPVKISFAAHGDQSWQEIWNRIVTRFNEKHGPNVTAEFFTSEPDGFKKYFVLIASGEMWDIFRNEEKRMPEFAKIGGLLDVTSLASKDKEANKSDFPESVWFLFLF